TATSGVWVGEAACTPGATPARQRVMRAMVLIMRMNLAPEIPGPRVLEICRWISLLVRDGLGDDVLLEAGRRRAMDHRVGVLDPDPVRPVVGLHDVHYGVVGLPVRPVALPLEHHGECRDRPGAGLDDPLHRVLVGER